MRRYQTLFYAAGPWERRQAVSAPALQRYQTLFYAAGPWERRRKVIARMEALDWRGLDRRFVVTTLDGRAKRLYKKDYCARGQAENLIYTRKRILASDRTSCRSPTANQLRIVLHTPAFLLLHQFRAAVPWRSLWRGRRFDTLRLGLVKVAAFIEEKRARVIVRLSEACPAQQTLAAALPRLAPQPP